MMLYVSEAIDKDVPTGYWCPAATVRFFPIQEDLPPEEPEQSDDGSVEDLLMVSIRGTDVVVYGSSTGSSPIPNGLAVGDQILCDRRIEIDSNGVIEERYRISQVIGTDQTLVGAWILVNKAVRKPNAPKVIFHNNSVKTFRAKSKAAAAPYADPATESATTPPQVDPNNVTLADGTTVTVPVYGYNGVVGEANVVVNTADVSDATQQQAVYETYGYDYTSTTDTSLMGSPVGRMLFVHGMPFQWTYITDRRGNSTNPYGRADNEAQEDAVHSGSADMYGRTFARDIAANMPIAVFTPGKPRFMTSVGVGGGNEAQASEAFAPAFSDPSSDAVIQSVQESMDDISGDYQYYSMEVDTASYFQYVNSLCQTSARLLGLGGVTYRGVSCTSMDWGSYNQDAAQDWDLFQSVIGLDKGVSFAFDPQSSISDTMTNQTEESQFLSKFTDIGSKARELEFILGYTGTGANELIDSANYIDQAKAELGGSGTPGLNNAIDRIGTWLNNAAHGMNIRFPELWSDSSHTPSYDIDMHFIAPYATAFCKWRYVLVPFFHLFALTAPKTDVNSSQYSSPFLVRAYSKGYFNIEMGMVESLTWKRFGDGDMIAEDGVPTQMDVTVSLKDLYHTLTMTNMFHSVGLFMNNTGLMDLIGTLSGVNMNRVSIADRISLGIASGISSVTSMPKNFMRSISDRVRNVSNSLHLYGV